VRLRQIFLKEKKEKNKAVFFSGRLPKSNFLGSNTTRVGSVQLAGFSVQKKTAMRNEAVGWML
jgi:hypothetical protein